ncbi:hypothetical protein GF391_01680 [Candidatus Uhrbacteria bacterium]|nr:hypothetical protein [Candidatus Uhrbacteria bacterium]
MTNEKNVKTSDESGMIKEDPAFDPSWDLKVAQQPVKQQAESVEDKHESAGRADEPTAEAKPDKQAQTRVEAEGFESGEEVPEFIKKQEETKEEKHLPSDKTEIEEAVADEDVKKQVQAEQVAPIPAPIKQKEEDVQKKSKIIWGDIISCWVLGIGTILIIVLLLLFLVVKSGIVNVPFLSDWLYNAPMPERYVTAAPMSWEGFRDLATDRLMAQDLDAEPPVLLSLNEIEFTGLLEGVIRDGLRSSVYDADVAQVVILPDSVELYFFLTWRDLLTFEILTHLSPVVEDDGTLRFEVVDARFGDLPLPGEWVLRVVGYFFARDVGAWRIVLSNGYGIQSVELENSAIQLFIGPVAGE